MVIVKQPSDVNRVNTDDADELHYWTERFHVSEAELRTAVEKVGVMVDDVQRELKGTASGGQSSG
jgi:Protein of unknown function (DUF3606)